jgi:hypothetical protein
MVEMAYGLPYEHEDYTVAINLVGTQLEQDLSQSQFARDQDRLEMMRILNEERVEYSKGKERVSSSDEVEARMLIKGTLQEDLFGDNQAQDLLQVRDAMNAQEEVFEPSMDDSNSCEQGQENDNTRADAPVENQAADQEDSIIDETLDLSTVKASTRSKSKKYVIPTSISPPNSEDQQPRPSRR